MHWLASARLSALLLPRAPWRGHACLPRRLSRLSSCPLDSTPSSHTRTLSAAPPLQVGLYTATMPEALQEVAAAWLHSPEHIRISATSAASISRSVTQVVQVCAEHKKPAKLVSETGGGGRRAAGG